MHPGGTTRPPPSLMREPLRSTASLSVGTAPGPIVRSRESALPPPGGNVPPVSRAGTARTLHWAGCMGLSGSLDLPGSASLRHESLRSVRAGSRRACPYGRSSTFGIRQHFRTHTATLSSRRRFAAGPRIVARTHFLEFGKSDGMSTVFAEADQDRYSPLPTKYRSAQPWIPWVQGTQHRKRSLQFCEAQSQQVHGFHLAVQNGGATGSSRKRSERGRRRDKRLRNHCHYGPRASAPQSAAGGQTLLAL